MRTTITNRNEWTVVSIRGAFELREMGKSKEKIEVLGEEEGLHLAFDLSETEIADSSAIALMVSMKKRVTQNRGKFIIVNPNESIREVFIITGLDKIVSVYESWEEFDSQVAVA